MKRGVFMLDEVIEKLDGCIVWNATIQYSAGSACLSVFVI